MTALSYVISMVSGIMARLKRFLSIQTKKFTHRNYTSIKATATYDPTIVDRSQRIPLIIRNMHRSGTLLDVGCGGIKHTTFDEVCATGDYDLIIGVDAHKRNIDERSAWASSRQDSASFKFMHGRIQDIKFDRTFDVILLSHVIEHVTLEEAENILNYLWSICNKQMVVETPNEFEDGRSAVAEYKNPYQEHRCLVDHAFMARHGFTKIFAYFQESGFSNSVYKRDKSNDLP